MPRGQRVVDIGCGTGLLYDLLAPENYYGFDPSQDMLDQFLAKHPGVNVSYGKYETQLLPTGDIKVALFGSPSYIHPEVLNFRYLRNYFLMFYREGYIPALYSKYQVSYPGYRFSEFAIGDSYSAQFSDWVIVTDLR